jgi:hypothetical protein
MNKFSSQQRKLIYLGGIVLLFIPIVALGLPKSEEQKGGKLARLRTEHYLDETTLGDVPPEGATMNLVLLGMRGVATNVLWLELIHQQKTKNWAEVKATTESIIKLQPHFLKVWQHQGWNLAYNVSAEWDLVADRYYWVKEGIKFYQRGISQNFMYPELDWYLGDTYAKKIGRADERLQFRRFFKDDPNKADFPSGIDPAVNPQGLDNYQVAKERYQKSIDIERRFGHQQHIMAAALYQSYPARADFDYAAALQKGVGPSRMDSGLRQEGIRDPRRMDHAGASDGQAPGPSRREPANPCRQPRQGGEAAGRDRTPRDPVDPSLPGHV